MDLFDDAAVLRACFDAEGEILWSPTAADGSDVIDRWSGVRWCIDRLRRRDDLRARFPRALTEGAGGAFATWAAQTATASARAGLHEAFAADPGARPLQAFLSRPDLLGAFPLGLTPHDRRAPLRWFMRHGRSELGMRLEEIWWFFLATAEDPSAGLVRTYLFTPEWQRRFPDGLHAGGRVAFAAWLGRRYRVRRETAAWLNPVSWPVAASAVDDLVAAYRADPAWQARAPTALDDPDAAKQLLAWAGSRETRLGNRVEAKASGAAQFAAPGLNLLAHFHYPSGLRTSAESIAQGLSRAGVGLSLRDVPAGPLDEPGRERFAGVERYGITLLHVQPRPGEALAATFDVAGLAEAKPRTHRIAYWYWELPTLPDGFVAAAREVDEVWAATEFVANIFRTGMDCPVYAMLPGVRLPAREPLPCEGLDLPPPGTYAFLFAFHMPSTMARKNPLALIAAFRRAFRPDEDAALVLKVTYGEGNPGAMRALREAAQGARVHIVDAALSIGEVMSLMERCDAYVSLHRSEGLGLTMGEAMLLGKPVVATGYSGNVDFMNAGNSLLVDHALIDVPVDAEPPYGTAGGRWAEPSIEHAALLMRRLYDNRAWGVALGARARTEAERTLSLEAAGQRMRARILEIRTMRAAAASAPRQ